MVSSTRWGAVVLTVAATAMVLFSVVSAEATRVVVRLAVDDGTAVATAQDEVVQALPAGSFRVLQRYANSPYLALEVTPAGLEALRRLPRVAGIAADFELSPQAPTQ